MLLLPAAPRPAAWSAWCGVAEHGKVWAAKDLEISCSGPRRGQGTVHCLAFPQTPSYRNHGRCKARCHVQGQPLSSAAVGEVLPACRTPRHSPASLSAGVAAPSPGSVLQEQALLLAICREGLGDACRARNISRCGFPPILAGGGWALCCGRCVAVGSLPLLLPAWGQLRRAAGK